jgi:hypothetical protein
MASNSPPPSSFASSGNFVVINCAYVGGVAPSTSDGGVGLVSPRAAESLASRSAPPEAGGRAEVSSRPSVTTCPATTTASTVVTAAAATPVKVQPLPPLAFSGR